MARVILFFVFAAALSVAIAAGVRLGDGGRGVDVNPVADADQGEALIGGPFTLTDPEGNTVTEGDLVGHWSLVAFGYTYCPDVCPLTLQAVSDALDRLGNRADRIIPYFISVDPWRDTPSVMGQYAEHFHPSLVALTGTPEQIDEAASSYRVYRSPTSRPEDADYLVDHSSIVYLMGPDGRYVAHFSHGTTPEDIAAKLRGVL